MGGTRRSAQVLVLASAIVSSLASCFIDNPGERPRGAAGSGGDGGPGDAGASDVESGPTICTKIGGYDVVETMSGHVLARVASDCRISGFFAGLSPEAQQHIADCLTKQLAVITHCEGIHYDVDSNGKDCRDMKTSHHGLGIRSEDFQAFLDDMKTALLDDGMSDADFDAISPALGFTKSSIVTNSAPHLSKDACDAGDAGP